MRDNTVASNTVAKPSEHDPREATVKDIAVQKKFLKDPSNRVSTRISQNYEKRDRCTVLINNAAKDG